MYISHYIGLDVHKRSISYCVKTADGQILEEGKLRATHQVLREWAQKRSESRPGAMEATLFSGGGFTMRRSLLPPNRRWETHR